MTNYTTAAADAAFNDAWEQYDSAIERLDAGDIRDACGKAWNATRAATRAAALAHDEDPQNTNHISSWIRRMGRETVGFELMPLMFGARARFLHQQACYDGHIDDPDIPDLIYGTADYIRQAQQLASI
jgi:cation transport regulator ChaB